MEKGDDPYEILGIPTDADEESIKKAYRKLALKCHPDRQQSEADKESAHDTFAKVAAAYDVLTDPVKRYDWKQTKESATATATSPSSTTSANGNSKSASRQTTKSSSRSTSRQPSRQTSTSRQSQQTRQTKQSKSSPTKSNNPKFSTAYRGQPQHHREDPHAPNTTYSSTPHRKESIGPRRTTAPRTAPSHTKTTYSATPHVRENPHAPNTTYSATPHTKERVSPRPRSPKGPSQHAHNHHNHHHKPKKFANDDIHHHGHRRTLSKQKAATPKSAPTHRRVFSGKTRLPSMPLMDHSNSQHSSKSAPPMRHSSNKSKSKNNPDATPIHDPFEVFERIMHSEFRQDDIYGRKTNARRKAKHSNNKNSNNNTLLRAKPAHPSDRQAVLTVTTATRAEPRKDGKVEIKTITKIKRADGTVEKVVQASVATSKEAKSVPVGTTTLAREAVGGGL